MRVLVTGGTGFLGGHVVAELLRRDHEVAALVRPGRMPEWLASLPVQPVQGDLRDARSLQRACADVEALVHCAAHTGAWSRHDAEQRAVNVEGTAALIRAAHARKLARIVHVSSIAAVGVSRDGTVLDESAHWNGARLGLHLVRTRKEAEERAFAAARGGVPIVVVNPGAMLGPRLDGRPGSSLVSRVAGGRVRWAPQGGMSVADVEDVACGVVEALLRGRTNQRYILGGHNVTWAALYAEIARVAGRPERFREIPAVLRHAAVPAAVLLQWLGLDAPTRAPELFRVWGLYGWVDSGKAQRELGYSVRPLPETARRAVGAAGQLSEAVSPTS